MIKNVQIQNFKSIKDQEVSLGDFSVLIGENGVGKTNFIYAIMFMKNMLSGRSADAAWGHFALIPSELIYKKSNNNSFSIKTCVMNGDDKKYYIEMDFVLDESTPSKSVKIQREKLEVLLDGEQKKRTVFERDNENVKVYTEPGQVAALNVDTGISAISVIDDPVTSKVKDIFANVYVTEADMSKRMPLEDRVSNIILSLRKNEQSYATFLKVIKKMIPSLSSLVDISDEVSKIISSPTGRNEYQILFTEDTWKGQLSLKAGSHGDLRTLYIIALSIYAPTHSTLIFEEVENGIHTKRTRDLIEFLEKISIKDEKQFIVSTHSSRIINKIKADDLILVKKTEDGSKYEALKNIADMGVIDEILEKGGDLSELVNN